MGWLCTRVWGSGVLVGVTAVVGGCGWFRLLVCRVSLPVVCVSVFGCGSVMIGVTPVFGCVWDSMHSCGMWWVAYYSGVSMWLGWLSSLWGVGLFTVESGGLG